MSFTSSIARSFVSLAVLIVLATTLRAAPPATLPATRPDEPANPTEFAAATLAEIAKTVGVEGSLKGDTYTITVPRTDLDLSNDNGTIPIAAGIASTFHFYKCPCGKTNVIGQFVVPDYEANDVIDALRKAPHIEIAAVSPMLIGERPKLLVIHFQGEGDAPDLATALKAALDRTGAARMKSRPIEK